MVERVEELSTETRRESDQYIEERVAATISVVAASEPMTCTASGTSPGGRRCLSARTSRCVVMALRHSARPWDLRTATALPITVRESGMPEDDSLPFSRQ